MRTRLAALVLVLLGSVPASAADLAVNAGVLEVVTLPEPAHGGFYPSVGVSLVFPLGPVTLIPSLALEWAFELGRGGLVLGFTADFPLGPRLGFDLNVTLLHDQPGLDIARSAFFLGAGPGLSIFLGAWTISPFVSAFAGLSAGGWSLAPGVNVAWTPG
jgi:hypothetical protein